MTKKRTIPSCKYLIWIVSVCLILTNSCTHFEDRDAPTDNNTKFWIINGLDTPGTDIIGFSVFQGITADETTYVLSVARNNNTKVAHSYSMNNFEVTTGVFLEFSGRREPFASRSFLLPKDTVWTVYWHPAQPPLSEDFFANLKNKDKVLGKIVVYEMNETNSK